MSESTLKSTSNPFSTRWVRPGAIPFLFTDGSDVKTLVGALRENDWRGVIVGPHGSGKSTLLATLVFEITNSVSPILQCSLHAGQRFLPLQITCGKPAKLYVVDGFEQLNLWSRWKLLSHCIRHQVGLLITTHEYRRCGGLPVLYRTSVDLTIMQTLVERLCNVNCGYISLRDVAEAFHLNQGNARETLFALYDLHEQRQRNELFSQAQI